MANPFFRPATRKEDNTTEAFPGPPPFYKSFTQSNVSTLATSLKALRNEHDYPPTSSTDPALAKERLARDNALRDAHPHLRHLIPPPPPADGKWRCFGEEYNVHAAQPISTSASTSTSTSTSTAPTTDPRQTLLKTTRKSLLHYLRLVSILSANPELAAPEIDAIRANLTQAHEAANQYRPHQARETLIEMLEGRLENGRREIEKVREMEVKVGEVIASLGEEEDGVGKEGPEGEGGDEVWRALDGVSIE